MSRVDEAVVRCGLLATELEIHFERAQCVGAVRRVVHRPVHLPCRGVMSVCDGGFRHVANSAFKFGFTPSS